MSDLKATQISDHIWRLGIRVLLPIHVWIVCEQDGITLVDGGIGWMEKGIRRFIHDLGAGPLRRIVLTHGHYDHVGVIPALLREWDVPVYVHGSEIQFMEGRLPYPAGRKQLRFCRPGLQSRFRRRQTVLCHRFNRLFRTLRLAIPRAIPSIMTFATTY